MVSQLWCCDLGAAGVKVGVGVGCCELMEGLVQVLEADALDVVDVGRAVTAGTEVWRGNVADRTEATRRRHPAADGRAGRLVVHPESGFYCRARPARRCTSTSVVTFSKMMLFLM